MECEVGGQVREGERDRAREGERKVIRQIVVSDMKIIWNFPAFNARAPVGSDFFNSFVIARRTPLSSLRKVIDDGDGRGHFLCVPPEIGGRCDVALRARSRRFSNPSTTNYDFVFQ